MRVLIALCLALAGCSSLPAMPDAQVQRFALEATQLSGRMIITTPEVFILPSWHAFQKAACGHNCGLGMATAVYVQPENKILVNAEIIPPGTLAPVMVHELVHAAQYQAKDQHPCIEQEAEAYRAQLKAMGYGEPGLAYEYALKSCAMTGR